MLVHNAEGKCRWSLSKDFKPTLCRNLIWNRKDSAMNKVYSFAGLLLVWTIFLTGCKTQPQENRGFLPEKKQTLLPKLTTVDENTPPEPKLNEQSTLEDYLAYAAINNPGLEAAFNRWKAALQQIAQDKSLPDPRFTYRYFVKQVETRVGAQKQAFGISQMFPWLGKLELRGNAAADAANAAKQRYETAKLKLFFQVKNTYYEYYYLWKAIGILKENIQLVENFERVTRTRYKVATGSHPDVIRAQVELGKLEDRLKTLQDLKSPIAAELNAALNRQADAALPWPKSIKEEYIPLTDRQVLQWMAKANPELKALQYNIAKSKTKIDLAKKDYYPDITVGVDFIDTADSVSANPPSNSGQDPVIATFSINLPIWKKKLDAGLMQAKFQHRAALRDKTQKLNALNAQLKLTLYQFRDGQRKINLYRDTLLPKAVESVKANETAFRAGGNSFLDLIDAQRVMLEFELAYERALSNKAQKLAKLEMLVGKQIPRIQK